MRGFIAILFFTSLLAVAVQGSSRCEATSCLTYDNKEYFTSYDTFDLRGAKHFCDENNGKLAVITSLELMELLKEQCLSSTSYFEFPFKNSENLHRGTVTKKLESTWTFVEPNVEYKALCEKAKCLKGDLFSKDICFSVSTDKYSFLEAEDYCKNQSMQLASIHSEAEQNFIKERLSEKVWIGLAERPQLGQMLYEWLDGTPLDYQNWYPGQPDHTNNKEYCVELRPNTYRWNDCDCSLERSAVCKGKAMEPQCAP